MVAGAAFGLTLWTMNRRPRVDESGHAHARPQPRRGASAPVYDAVHDIREGRATELDATVPDDEVNQAGMTEAEAARQERLAASPEAAAEEASADAGPDSARREALGSSPEVQAEEAERLLERRPRSRDERSVGTKKE
jgi:hypothetical protein